MFIFHMDYIELDLDSAVATESAFNDNSSLDTPVFELGRDLQNVVGFKIIETNIPSSYFTITDEVNSATGRQRNLLRVVIGTMMGPGPFNLYITPNRKYTASELAAEIQSLIGTLDLPLLIPPTTITSTCTYSDLTGKFTISMTPSPYYTNMSVTILFDESVAKLLGFQSPNSTDEQLQLYQISSTTFSFTSSYLALVSGPNYMQINSKFFSNVLKNYLPQGPLGTVGQTNTAICQVPVTANFGGVNYWQTIQPDSFDTQNLFMLDRFDLFLTLGTSKIPLKLNGLSWQCKIRVFIDRNYTASSLQGNIEQNRIIKRIRPT
jgi:hypothetical protein